VTAVVPQEIERVLISEQEIAAKVAELAEQVDADYAARRSCWSGVLKGAVMFMADFARALSTPVSMEFMAVSSYGSSTSSSGVVRILKDLDRDIVDKHVVVVEDVIDSGLTLSWLLKNMRSRGPASVEVVALLRKPEAAEGQRAGEVRRLRHRTEFVVGYGSTTPSATATCRSWAAASRGVHQPALSEDGPEHRPRAAVGPVSGAAERCTVVIHLLRGGTGPRAPHR
jgi:hypoxanthine phosphoribosyltransferase